MASLETQFLNVQKKIRQMAVVKMQQKMDRAAEATMSKAGDKRDYNDVTGNLYKSTAIGVYYKGSLQSIHYAPGAQPTRPTLAKGETYNLDRYYGSSFSFKDSGRKPYKGEYGEGGEKGPDTAEDLLYFKEHGYGKYTTAWQMVLVAGVDYAQFVERKKGHDVISSLRDYMVRYFTKV